MENKGLSLLPLKKKTPRHIKFISDFEFIRELRSKNNKLDQKLRRDGPYREKGDERKHSLDVETSVRKISKIQTNTNFKDNIKLHMHLLLVNSTSTSQ